MSDGNPTDPNPSLFHIEARILELVEKHTDENGEVDPAFEDELDAMFAKRERKLLAYAHVIKLQRAKAVRLEAIARAIRDNEAKPYSDRAKRADSVARRLLARAEGSMSPGEKLEDDTAEFAWRMSQPRARVDPGAKVDDWPAEFRKSEPRLSALKDADKDGRPLPEGVVIEPGRKRLSVK